MAAVSTSELVRLAGGVAVLLTITAAVQRTARLRLGWSPYLAVLRGAVQLSIVGLLLRGVLDAAPPLAGLVLLVMLGTDTGTAARRLSGLDRPAGAVLTAILAGAGVALGVVFALSVLPFSARYIVALGGIVIGGAMTSATLAGRQLLAGLRSRREEVEGWLAIGATPRQAVLDVARSAAAESMVPNLDQTRTTGLVTLPGAFIGALLGGANPLQAARFQLIVLVALIASGSIVAVLITTLLGAPATLPAEPAR